MKKNKFIFYLLISLLVSCNNNKKQKLNYTLSKVKTYEYAIDNTTHYFSYFTYVLHDKYLLRDNYNSNSTYLLDINNQKIIKNDEFKIEGPNGIPDFPGAAVYPLKKDSLVVVSVSGRTYITDKNKVVFSRKNIKNNEVFRSYGLNPYQPKLYNGCIYLWKSPDFLPKENQFFTQANYFKFNLKTHSLKNIPIYHLNKTLGASNLLLKTYFTQKGNNLIIGFGNTPKLLKFNMDTNKVTDTITPYTPPEVKVKFINNEDESEAIKLKNNYFFYNIIYDKYRDIYYRFIFSPVSDISKATKKYDFFQTMPFIIQTLDADFNTLAINKFKENTYNLYDYFVTKEGLWISKNNFNNPNFDENKQVFDIFKLTAK